MREKHMFARQKNWCLVSSSKIGTTPMKKGISALISRSFFRLVALQANMDQVEDYDKMNTVQVKATLTITVT